MKWLLLLLLVSGVDAGPEGLSDMVAGTGRVVTIGDTPDNRVGREFLVAPGAPPLLSFRAYEGKVHQHVTGSDLMLDDAGH